MSSLVRVGMESVRSVVSKGGAVVVGVGVIITQCSLAILAHGAFLGLSGVQISQHAAQSADEKRRAALVWVDTQVKHAQRSVQSVLSTLLYPFRYVIDSLHFGVDIVESLVEKQLQIVVSSSPLDPLYYRVFCIGRGVVDGIWGGARRKVIDPTQRNIEGAIEQLKHALILASEVKKEGEKRIVRVSSSVNRFKMRLEKEARECNLSSEVVLMRVLLSSSSSLVRALNQLKRKNSEVLGEGRATVAIEYIEGLQKNLSSASDIYQVKEEVIQEASSHLHTLLNHLHLQ